MPRHEDEFPVTVRRNKTANGGWEWFLLVGGKRVQTNEHRVGIFTGPDVQPEEIMPRLLAEAVKVGA